MSFFRLISGVKVAQMSSKSGKLPKTVATKDATKCEATASPVSLHKEGYLLLLVNVKPNSKESAVAAIDDKQAHIQISAPPKDGEANEELIAYLSKVTGAKKSQLSVVKGQKSRVKTVRFDSDSNLTQEKLLALLNRICN